jgi:SAM-dependent methyltransferase
MDDAICITKAFYERHSKGYIEGRDPYFLDRDIGRFAHYFLQHQPKDGAVLDIGCANGLRYPSLKLHLPHVHYSGIDLTQAFVLMARERYPHTEFLEGNIADCSTLPKRQFAGIWCSSVLQHLPASLMQVALINIYRLLKPGGVAYISLPNEHTKSKLADVRHFTILPPAVQREYLLRSGFKILDAWDSSNLRPGDVWSLYIVQRD